MQAQQIFRTRNRVFQRAVRVIQLRGLFQAPLLLLAVGFGVDVGVELAAQGVEVARCRWQQGGEISIDRDLR